MSADDGILAGVLVVVRVGVEGGGPCVLCVLSAVTFRVVGVTNFALHGNGASRPTALERYLIMNRVAGAGRASLKCNSAYVCWSVGAGST